MRRRGLRERRGPWDRPKRGIWDLSKERDLGSDPRAAGSRGLLWSCFHPPTPPPHFTGSHAPPAPSRATAPHPAPPHRIPRHPTASRATLPHPYRCRVLRHWLTGSRKGETDILVDSLPGLPDGITRRPGGGFWLALPARLSPLLKVLAPYPTLRQLVGHVIVPAFPLIAKPWGAVLRLDETGAVAEALYDTKGSHVATVSAATEHDGHLYLGNLNGDFVSVLKL